MALCLMPRTGYPRRPGSTVVPAGWEPHHEPTVEAAFTARCRLRDPAKDTEGPLDRDTGTHPIVKAAPYYDGPCRIQQLHQPQTAETAGQVVLTHDYLLQVPKSVTQAAPQHVAEIYDATDATINGRELEVSDVARGSLTWCRDLTCLDNLGRAGA